MNGQRQGEHFPTSTPWHPLQRKARHPAAPTEAFPAAPRPANWRVPVCPSSCPLTQDVHLGDKKSLSCLADSRHPKDKDLTGRQIGAWLKPFVFSLRPGWLRSLKPPETQKSVPDHTRPSHSLAPFLPSPTTTPGKPVVLTHGRLRVGLLWAADRLTS